MTIKKALRNRLAGAKKIAVLGIGSELRSDDVAGMLAAEKLYKDTAPELTEAQKKMILFANDYDCAEFKFKESYDLNIFIIC